MLDFTNNSYDEKIMRWNLQDFSSLVESFTPEELKEMLLWLTDDETLGCVDAEYLIDPKDGMRNATIVYEYMCRQLFRLIDNGVSNGTTELLDCINATLYF